MERKLKNLMGQPPVPRWHANDISGGTPQEGDKVWFGTVPGESSFKDCGQECCWWKRQVRVALGFSRALAFMRPGCRPFGARLGLLAEGLCSQARSSRGLFVGLGFGNEHFLF